MIRPRVGPRLGLSAVLTLGLLVATCTGESEPLGVREATSRVDPSFVGRVEGTDAFFGIGQPGGGAQVVAYLCDGDPSDVGRKGATSEWFVGVRSDDDIDLTSRNGVQLQARFEGDVVRGTLTFQGGRALEFTAEQAEGDEAGLYREEASVGDAAYLLGWVVLNDGKARGSSFPPFIRCAGPLGAPLGRVFGRICP
ncbi:MAG: hypothetical protein M3314_10070 [Actinomycetota bacterium]|nr:hypothetical protein [Actinomycetota bacterium]